MKHTPVTADLDPQTTELVKRVAEAQGRSMEEFATDAIREAAEQEAELLDYAQAGIDDLDAGRWITHEQLVQWLEARRAGRDAA